MNRVRKPLTSPPRNPLPQNHRPVGGVVYRVRPGDTWETVAREADLPVGDLIEYNFRTRNPREVNWYLQRNVGCRNTTADGKNYVFRGAIPGVIYLPFYLVYPFEQPNDTSCWAASMAMVVSFKRQQAIQPQRIASEVGMDLNSSYGWDVLYDAAQRWGLESLPSASLTGRGWLALLQAHGPLWLVEVGNPSHAVVLIGYDGAQFYLNDPWPPAGRKTRTVAQLNNDFGGALSAVGDNVQLLYAR